jgi:hypothetical protein
MPCPGRIPTPRERGKAVARLTGLEPATPGVTGRYSNQLSYNRSLLLLSFPAERWGVLWLRFGIVKRRLQLFSSGMKIFSNPFQITLRAGTGLPNRSS